MNLVAETTAAAAKPVPLVVDLDGTLLRGDLLVEGAFAHLGRNPAGLPALLAALARGKAALKAHVADATDIDATHLPYDTRVIELIAKARIEGRPVYLASAGNERYIAAVAGHLGHFDGWFASDARENLSSHAKARRLVEAFGEGGFDYIGNDAADLPVWAAARRSIAVHPPASVRRRLLTLDPKAVVLDPPAGQLRNWLRLLRVHQWAKNALVFVPLLTAQAFHPLAIIEALAAFLAFSLAASGVYLINDLVDLDADRKHPSKKRRPLAAGTIPVGQAVLAAPILVTVALAIALAVAPLFAVVLAGYLALTTAYTFYLKRRMMIDVVSLAMLYTGRVIGGAAAISVVVSEWLLAFSMFIFTALALVKRYIELAGRLDANLPDPSNRDYRKADLDIVAALAAAAGFNAVTVFALYVSSPAVHKLYTHPQALWLICPVLMYWIGRMLMLAHRREIDDDPILFAVKDRHSLAAALVIGIILLVAK